MFMLANRMTLKLELKKHTDFLAYWNRQICLLSTSAFKDKERCHTLLNAGSMNHSLWPAWTKLCWRWLDSKLINTNLVIHKEKKYLAKESHIYPSSLFSQLHYDLVSEKEFRVKRGTAEASYFFFAMDDKVTNSVILKYSLAK